LLKNDLYLILFKNTILSRIIFVPEVEYALNVMLQNILYDKQILWLITAVGIQIASIINYALGYAVYLSLNYFKKLEGSTYFTIKQNCSKLILLLLLLSFFSNGGGIIVLIAGFLRVNFKMTLLVTFISSVLGTYLKIFM
jgi:membrane protein YqaA with SNARE-associated domain